MGTQRSAYDLVAIGAGVIGLACAWRAAQAGMSVLVLERDKPGAGASGVAAGMLAPVTEADFGEEALLALNLRSRELWSGFAAELEELSGMPSGYADDGALVVAADRDDTEELRRLHAFQRSLDLDADWLAPRRCRELEPGLSPRVGGAILAPQDGQVDPRAVIRALVVALRRAGGELVTGAEVVALEVDGSRGPAAPDPRAAAEAGGGRVTGVRTADGRRVSAGAVLVAAGAWSGLVAPASQHGAVAVRPVKGQLLELRVRPGHFPPARRVIRTPRCYLVTRARDAAGEVRVVVGATVEDRGFDVTVTVDAVLRLLEAAWEVLPEIGELELVCARAGVRPGTPDNSPAIGWGQAEGLLWATGHYRNGVLLAPLTARAVLDLLRGAEPPEDLRPFDPGRFDSARVA